MRGCGRQFCPSCGAELIHRDNRAYYESASAFGQIVWREGPCAITTGDIDHYCVKRLRGGTLLRIVEHKQPRQQLGQDQRAALRIIDEIIEHYLRTSPADASTRLDPRSGVYIVRGIVEAIYDRHRTTHFQGRQTATRLLTNAEEHLDDQEAVFVWLESYPGGARRQHGRCV